MCKLACNHEVKCWAAIKGSLLTLEELPDSAVQQHVLEADGSK